MRTTKRSVSQATQSTHAAAGPGARHLARRPRRPLTRPPRPAPGLARHRALRGREYFMFAVLMTKHRTDHDISRR